MDNRPQDAREQTTAQPNTESIESHNHRFRFLKAHLTLSDYILLPLTAVLLAGLGVAASYRYFWTAALLGFASVLLFILLFHLHYRHGFQKKQKISRWAWILAVGTVVFVLSAAIVFAVAWTSPKPPVITYFGALTPATEKPASIPAGSPPNVFQLWLGDDLRVLTVSAKPVLAVGGKPFLSIEDENGQMQISATIPDATGQPICRIIRNEFECIPERAFNPLQPNQHSLFVRDEDGNLVFAIRFLTPNSMSVIGIFQLPGSKNPVRILPQGIYFPSGEGLEHMTLDFTKSSGDMFNVAPN